MNASLADEIRYRLLRYLERHPHASQRELAAELGVSVGKVNYCVRALIERGWVKMRNFRSSPHKLSYAYILTPKGIEEKVSVTSRFLRRKIDEYNALSEEIERLTREVNEGGDESEEQSRAAGFPSA